MTILVPVLSQQPIKAWPKNESGGRARYMPLADALSQSFATDAHFAGYCVPSLERRLDMGALGHAPLQQIGGHVAMQLAIFDVDAASSHKALGGDGAIPASDEWWLAELVKLDRLRAEHPDLFQYRTRGGYRVVGVLREPFLMNEPEHGAVWGRRYMSWVAYLRRRFTIAADAMHDWPRLFRLPHATRDGSKAPEQRETVGDPAAIGVWDPDLSDDDREHGAKLTKKKPPKERPEKPPTEQVYSGDGVLFHALQARSAIRSRLEAGKWSIDCPRASEHSHDSQTGTILYAPGVGDTLGWVKCSHSGSGHDRLTLADWLACFTKEELAAARPAAGIVGNKVDEFSSTLSTPARPAIRVGTDLHRVVDEACAALAGVADAYQRAGELVHVTCAAETDARRGVVEGAPQIRPMALATLRETLTRAATFERYDARSETYRACSPPDNVVSAVLARGMWPGVRPIAAVIEAPTLRADGSILDSAGYDTKTGLLLVPSCTVPAVIDRPAQHDAARALRELCEPLAEMPWAGEADRYAVASGILTLVGRAAIDGPVPGLAVDANAPGSGKSLATDAIAIVASGRSAARVTWPETIEELDKVLSSYATTAAPLVAIDNVTTPVEGGPLDKALTAERVEIRPLGRTAVLSLPWRALVTLTGNGLDVRGDTRRRLLVARLEPLDESPEDRTGFKIPDLRAWCREHRGRLIAAALTLLRAYVVAGRPNMGTRTWGSYESWAALVPPAIVFAGGIDPMGCQLRPEEDGHRQALVALLTGWRRIAPHGETTRGMLAHLYPPERVRGERIGPDGSRDRVPPDGNDDMRAALETLVPMRQGQAPEVRKLGALFQRLRRRTVAGLRLDSPTTRQRYGVWVVSPVSPESESHLFAGDLADVVLDDASACSAGPAENDAPESPHSPNGQPHPRAKAYAEAEAARRLPYA
jgi:hypothetical protein